MSKTNTWSNFNEQESAHMNWPHQEGYVPASELRTQERTGKNNLKL
jgi:hypothetical protein